MPRLPFVCGLTAIAVVAFAPSLLASGRWNMPSRGLQMVGWGYGPGYHAPLVLGPAWGAEVEDPGVRRLSCPPAVQCQPQGYLAGQASVLAVPAAFPAELPQQSVEPVAAPPEEIPLDSPAETTADPEIEAAEPAAPPRAASSIFAAPPLVSE